MRPIDFRTVVDVARDAVAVLDLDGRYLYANPAAVALARVSAEAMLGHSYLELWPDLADGVFDLAFRRVAGSGQAESIEAPSTRPDTWVRCDLASAGEGLVRVTWHEITDRKRLEEERRRSTEYLGAAVEAAQLGTWEYEAGSPVIRASPRQLELMGLRPDEPLTLEVAYQLSHPDDRPALQAAMEKAAAGDPFYLVEHRIRARDGVERRVRSTGRALSRNGQLVRLVGCTLDVTEEREHERKQRFLVGAGELLNSSLDRDETLRKVARLAIGVLGDACIIDLIEDGALRRVEVAYDERTADPGAERIRALDPARYPPGHPVVQAAQGKAVLVAGYTDEMAVATASNPQHLEAIRAARVRSLLCVPLRTRGEVLGVITFVRRGDQTSRPHTGEDLTLAEDLARHMALAIDNARRHRQVEDALREREALIEQLQRALRTADLFVGILGHDLRNPLSAILGGAKLLQQAGDEGVARTAARIHSSGARMSELIEDLLDFTRIRVGRGLELQPRPADLLEISTETIAEVQDAYPLRRIECRSTGDCKGVWDPDRVAQVVSNLVGNAVQHSPDDTPVRVTLDGGSADRVCVRVHNQGPPIPEELRDGLFDPFKRAARTRDQGLGLGLYISDQIARLHGGRLEVRSSAADGTEFIFELPRRRD